VADLKERQYYGLLPQWEKPKKFKFQGVGLGWEEERNLEDQLAEVSEHLIGLSGAGKEQAEELFVTPGVGGLPFVSNLTVEYEDQNKLESLYRQIQPWGRGLNFWCRWFWKEEFTYDHNGNVINKKNGWGEINYTYNESNQLLQAGNRSYQYDLNGNLLREELGASYAEYEYSPENRIITARNNAPQIYPDGGFLGEINYAYDALGRKVSKEINPEKGNKGNREYYLYAGLGIDIIAQYEMEIHSKKQGKGKNPHDPAGELTRIQEYYYGNGFLLAAKTIDKPDKYGFGYGVNHGYGRGGSGKGWGNIDPLKDVTFYHQDALGSVVMLTGHNGQVVERYEYDVYGIAYNGKFDHGLAGMGGNSYGFTGKRYEPEMGIYSFAFRDYNPQNMRWMTEDPIKDGINWYEYCGSDPVNWVDPLGLDAIVLNDSDAVKLPGGPYGHNAVLIGDDDSGFVYYSKDGTKAAEKEINPYDPDDERTRTERGNFRKKYESLEEFEKDPKVSGRYDRSVRIKTMKEQDQAMIKKAEEIWDKEYDLLLENCADLVEQITTAGGIDLSGADINIDGVRTTVPNLQFEVAQNIQETQGLAQKEDSCAK
jgi:RHS repeat-associated protein